MTLLGIDTGGTFTDAVLYDDTTGSVVASAKSPTTYHDLAIGITGAIDAVLEIAAAAPEQVELVCLSTTLATNALVEGRGRGVGLFVIGFDEDFAERAGLSAALSGAPIAFLPGGHNAHGGELAPFDPDLLRAELDRMAGRMPSGVPIEAYAVAAQFSVRNPAHERAARDVIRAATGRPVSCSHELSAQLNAPKRAVTAVLNARLIPIIDELLATVEGSLAARGMTAPLMVVRGDGSLVSASFVRERPIETILSGPAASLVGAAHLAGSADAFVSDIGGTTTDVALLRGGRPVISADGATVGGHRTMVEAVAMHTFGLGGDSEVRHDPRSRGAVVIVGPRRVIPVSQLAMSAGAAVEGAMRLALATPRPGEWSGILAMPARAFTHWEPTGPTEMAIHQALSAGEPVPVAGIPGIRRATIDRLVREGVIVLSGFTPTDACHVLGLHDHFDVAAARLAAEVFSRHRDAHGMPIAADPEAVSRAVVDAVIGHSADAILGVAFVEDGLPAELVDTPFVRRSLSGTLRGVAGDVGLRFPLVGLGASAATYYPAVAERLRTPVVIPAHAGVANAVGAVVGRVSIARTAAVRSPADGQFLVHLGEEPTLHLSVEAARGTAEERLRALVIADLAAAGASHGEFTVEWAEQVVDLGGLSVFVEGTLTVRGAGRPDLTSAPRPGGPGLSSVAI